jgi:RimJ/RimL family protein N-acetyltransferase
MPAAADFIVETARYGLRLFRADDLDFLAGLYADPEVMRFYPSTKSREVAEQQIGKFAEVYATKGYTLWAVEEKATGAPIGRVGLWPLDKTAEVELGYMIARSHWSRGAATETSAACLKYGFEKLQLPFVAAICVPANMPSRRVMEKLGFQFIRHDRYYDMDVM